MRILELSIASPARWPFKDMLDSKGITFSDFSLVNRYVSINFDTKRAVYSYNRRFQLTEPIHINHLNIEGIELVPVEALYEFLKSLAFIPEACEVPSLD